MKRTLRFACGTLCVAAGIAAASIAQAADLPPDLKMISGSPKSSAADVSTQNILQLNNTMFELYGNAGRIFTNNIQAKSPIILGLFSGKGGRFILYRPGQAPLEAPSVPMTYQLLKSVGHSTMAVSEVVMPYLDNATDKSWRGPMVSYRTQMQSALDTIDTMPMQADWIDNNRSILKNNIAFMDDCVAKGVISYASVQAFAKKQAPLLRLNVKWAAETQVGHWMGVLAGWKKMLGADWEKTYAASNTIYVARQNNVLFSILAQFFGPEAMNERVMLIETISFVTTPEEMLESLTRIISDRSVGQLFFGSYRLMDYELMGGDARTAIITETKKHGMKTFLPPVVPFGSKQWPTLITPGPGAASLDDLLK